MSQPPWPSGNSRGVRTSAGNGRTGSPSERSSHRAAAAADAGGAHRNQQRKRCLAHLPLDDARDQKSRYDKEQIDADEAAEHARSFEMKADHRQHGERAQSVDVFAIAAILTRALVRSREARDLEVPRPGISGSTAGKLSRQYAFTL